MTWRDVTGAVGAAALSFGVYALIEDLDPWHVVWYVVAWFGYFAILDAVVARWRGRGDVLLRKRHLSLFLWSIPFWFFFELYNIRIQNWYYVFTFHSVVISFLFSCLAFSTVLPACLLHEQVLRQTGWFARLRGTPVRVEAYRWPLATLGIACLVLPLAYPQHSYWMVWGSLLCLPEVLAHRLGTPSVLGLLERGDRERIGTLLGGGLWAGLMWEGLNFWARCKWVYTVPGLEETKLFEMPILGFVGFPGLALNAYPTWGLIQLGWSRGRLVQTGQVIVALATIFTGFTLTFTQTVHSPRPLLARLSGLTDEATAVLRQEGVETPEWFDRLCRSQTPEAIAMRLGLETETVRLACNHAQIALHKGMGTARADLLMRNGVLTLNDLSGLGEGALQNIILAGGDLTPPVRAAEVRLWCRSAADGVPKR
ncbi:MAG: hypothetical protein CME26_12190 [Gemmatimonadetes bacterium]|nr:hypothetical protein [Gemmatimonadota bacterium]